MSLSPLALDGTITIITMRWLIMPVISVKFNKIVLTAELLSVGSGRTVRDERDEKCLKRLFVNYRFICLRLWDVSECRRIMSEWDFLVKWLFLIVSAISSAYHHVNWLCSFWWLCCVDWISLKSQYAGPPSLLLHNVFRFRNETVAISHSQFMNVHMWK